MTLIHTLDGGFALSGNTDYHGLSSSDFWLVKFDSDLTYCGQLEVEYLQLIEESILNESALVFTDGGYAT